MSTPKNSWYSKTLKQCTVFKETLLTSGEAGGLFLPLLSPAAVAQKGGACQEGAWVEQPVHRLKPLVTKPPPAQKLMIRSGGKEPENSHQHLYPWKSTKSRIWVKYMSSNDGKKFSDFPNFSVTAFWTLPLTNIGGGWLPWGWSLELCGGVNFSRCCGRAPTIKSLLSLSPICLHDCCRCLSISIDIHNVIKAQIPLQTEASKWRSREKLTLHENSCRKQPTSG